MGVQEGRDSDVSESRRGVGANRGASVGGRGSDRGDATGVPGVLWTRTGVGVGDRRGRAQGMAAAGRYSEKSRGDSTAYDMWAVRGGRAKRGAEASAAGYAAGSWEGDARDNTTDTEDEKGTHSAEGRRQHGNGICTSEGHGSEGDESSSG